MKYNIEDAFSFIKRDNEWVKKLFIGTGISLVSVFLFFVPVLYLIISKSFQIGLFAVCWLISGILAMGIYGFCIQFGHDRIFEIDAKLPSWKEFWKFVFLSIKSLIGSILFFVPFFAIIFLLVLIGSALKVFGVNSTGSTFKSFLDFVYYTLYSIFMFLYYVFNANFLKSLNISSYLNVSAAFEKLRGKHNFISYLILFGLILALGFVLNIVGFLICITIIGIFLLPFAAIYMQLVSLNLMAQFIRITENEQ